MTYFIGRHQFGLVMQEDSKKMTFWWRNKIFLYFFLWWEKAHAHALNIVEMSRTNGHLDQLECSMTGSPICMS